MLVLITSELIADMHISVISVFVNNVLKIKTLPFAPLPFFFFLRSGVLWDSLQNVEIAPSDLCSVRPGMHARD